MGSDRPEKPDFQLGDGCLVDQLVGQYLADMAGLGSLVDSQHVRKTLESIYRYNYKRTLYQHESVQRIFALNDESALVICDYGKGTRPEIPFPYFAEVMTGFEYQAAVHMILAGMVSEGIECIANIRRRYDGERRNPFDEAECGHHYARAMASWSAIPALSGFQYSAPERNVSARPRLKADKFSCFWSAGTGWGSFSHAVSTRETRFALAVLDGTLRVRSVDLVSTSARQAKVTVGGRGLSSEVRKQAEATQVILGSEVLLKAGESIVITL